MAACGEGEQDQALVREQPGGDHRPPGDQRLHAISGAPELEQPAPGGLPAERLSARLSAGASGEWRRAVKASKIRRWQESNAEEITLLRAINGYMRGRNPQPGRFPVVGLYDELRLTRRGQGKTGSG